jgi:hypothetical protein
MISFEATAQEQDLANAIARRAQAIYARAKAPRKVMDIQMDIIATHANGCRLDLQRMHDADDFNFMHDVGGIARHLNRTTGQLENCFLPRFAMRCQRLEPGANHALKTTVLDKVGRIDKEA